MPQRAKERGTPWPSEWKEGNGENGENGERSIARRRVRYFDFFAQDGVGLHQQG